MEEGVAFFEGKWGEGGGGGGNEGGGIEKPWERKREGYERAFDGGLGKGCVLGDAA